MDFSVWFVVATALLGTVHAEADAEPNDKGPQPIAEGTPKPQKQHKRQQKYKEVIMYLTPTQIRALEAGHGVVSPQHAAQLVPPVGNHQPTPAVHNIPHNDQQIQQEAANAEADRKHRQHLQETVQHQQAKEAIEHQVTQPNVQEVQIPHPQNHQELPQMQLQLIPTGPSRPGEVYAKPDFIPDNYAYLYFYPNGRPQNLQYFRPQFHDQGNELLHQQQELHEQAHLNSLQHQFQLIPYAYNHNNHAHQLPQALLTASHQLPEEIPQAHDLPEALPQQEPLVEHQLPESLPQPQPLLGHHVTKAFPEALQLIAHQLSTGHLQDLEFHQLQPQQMEFPDLEQHLKSHQAELEAQHLANQLDAEQLKAHDHVEAHQLGAQIEAEQLKADTETQIENQLKADQHELKSQLKIQELGTQVEQKANELKTVLESQQKLSAQNVEALRMDAHHDAQQLEVDVQKAYELKDKLQSQSQKDSEELKALLEADKFKPSEPEKPGKVQFFEPNFGHLDTLLSPLLQHHSLMDTLRQKEKFEKNPPPLERGFKPLKLYSPKDESDRYVKEIEKILKSIRLENLEAIDTAKAIANQPPVVVHEDVKVTTHAKEIINVPMPFYVPVPEPYEVKVPQPYAVPVEIINHIPFPVLKMEKLEVEKPVPYQVEKHIQVPVTKNVYYKVDKPYFVEKRVPVEIRKKIPVKIPIRRPHKYTIVRHVWKH